MDLNKVQLIGRVGRDPESKKAGEKTIASFSVATSYGTGDNVKTEWHNCTAWDKQAEIALQILHKGDRVYIEGRLSYNTVGEGAEKKTYSQITVSNFINLTSKPAENGTGNGSTKAAGTSAVAGDIPF